MQQIKTAMILNEGYKGYFIFIGLFTLLRTTVTYNRSDCQATLTCVARAFKLIKISASYGIIIAASA